MEDLENQLVDIKPDGTMNTNMAYFITDIVTPITLHIYSQEYREGEPETILIDLSNIEVR